jgi:transposase-like protein
MSAEHEELLRLRKEVKRLRMERDILKNGSVAPTRHLWLQKLQSIGYRWCFWEERPFVYWRP